MPAKTVIIWDQLMEEPLSFIVLDGDYSKFDRIYINASAETSEEQTLIDELCDFMYTKNGERKHETTVNFPVAAVAAGAKVIVAGFLP